MAYTRNIWVNGASPAINSTNLNNIEQGLVNTTNPAYSTTVDKSAVRSFALSGNNKGALTQNVNGQSAINLPGDIGGLYLDDNADGVANEWTTTTTTSESLSNQIQSFTAAAQNGNFLLLGLNIEANKIYYARAEVESDSSLLRLTLSDNVDSTVVDFHSGSGNFEVLSARLSNDGTAGANGFIDIRDVRTSTWTETRVKKIMLINLTDTFGASSEPSITQCDLIFANYFDNIGHTTINQKITGTNDEFELKEPYVLPKTKDGTITTIIKKDGQNFIRPAHKQEVLSGELNWTGFATSGSVIYAYVDNISEEEFLSLTANSGDFSNNDFNFRMSTTISTIDNSATYNVTNSRLTLGILQSLAGTTQATYEAYLNSNPVKSSIALALAEYNTGLLDIPIKHLASVEDGTIINNSTILPSALTYTYPTNEAAERESSQIAQNQITTVESHVIEQDINTIFGTNTIDTQGVYNTPIKTIFSDTIDTFLSTSKITTEFIGGNIKTTITEV